MSSRKGVALFSGHPIFILLLAFIITQRCNVFHNGAQQNERNHDEAAKDYRSGVPQSSYFIFTFCDIHTFKLSTIASLFTSSVFTHSDFPNSLFLTHYLKASVFTPNLQSSIKSGIASPDNIGIDTKYIKGGLMK